jgi:hypothetical protein
MLDEVGRRIDHPGQEEHRFGEGIALEHLIFMLMARIGEFEGQSADVGLIEDR